MPHGQQGARRTSATSARTSLPTAGEGPIAGAARLLAAGGESSYGAVLGLVRDALGARALTLRAADGRVLARAEVDSPVPVQGGPLALDVPVRLAGRLSGILTATAGQPFRPEQGELLSAIADLLALALPVTGPVADPGRAILDAEADRAEVAAALRETVGGALATVRYAAEQVADGRSDAAALDDPLRAAAAAVDAVRGEARAYALDAGLRVALRELARRGDGDRPDDGRPDLRVSVTADDSALDTLPPAVAVTVERVAAAALRNATGRAAVRATYDGEWVKLSVESAEIGYDASELDRWARRASALGGVLRLRLDGVDLELPARAR